MFLLLSNYDNEILTKNRSLTKNVFMLKILLHVSDKKKKKKHWCNIQTKCLLTC